MLDLGRMLRCMPESKPSFRRMRFGRGMCSDRVQASMTFLNHPGASSGVGVQAFNKPQSVADE